VRYSDFVFHPHNLRSTSCFGKPGMTAAGAYATI
jgi:hypothetical protein